MKTQPILLLGALVATLATFPCGLDAAETPTASPQGAVRGLSHPIMTALDTDKDGELSAEEIDQAAAALKKLDRDGNGKIDRVELRLGTRELGINRGLQGRGQAPSGSRSNAGALFAQRIMRFDENGDGKVTQDELPESMDRVLERADTNKDNAIDRAEAQAFAQKLSGVTLQPSTIQKETPAPTEERKEEK